MCVRRVVPVLWESISDKTPKTLTPTPTPGRPVWMLSGKNPAKNIFLGKMSTLLLFIRLFFGHVHTNSHIYQVHLFTRLAYTTDIIGRDGRFPVSSMRFFLSPEMCSGSSDASLVYPVPGLYVIRSIPGCCWLRTSPPPRSIDPLGTAHGFFRTTFFESVCDTFCSF